MDGNADGWPDLIVGEHGGNVPNSVARAWVFGGNIVGLRADKSTLSLAQNESLTFQLHAGGIHTGKLYLLLGSLTGTAPARQLGSIRMPLTLYPYFWLTGPGVRQ